MIRDWLKEGKIKKKDPLTKTEKEGIKEVEKAFGGMIKFVDKDKNRDVKIITQPLNSLNRGIYGAGLRGKEGRKNNF